MLRYCERKAALCVRHALCKRATGSQQKQEQYSSDALCRHGSKYTYEGRTGIQLLRAIALKTPTGGILSVKEISRQLTKEAVKENTKSLRQTTGPSTLPNQAPTAPEGHPDKTDGAAFVLAKPSRASVKRTRSVLVRAGVRLLHQAFWNTRSCSLFRAG